jgi:16S rRNA C967 or C1407 C5-methylase (RsmB/RsmF family)
MTLGRRTKKQSKRKIQKAEPEFVVVQAEKSNKKRSGNGTSSDEDEDPANFARHSSNALDFSATTAATATAGLSVRARKRQRMAANRVWKHFDRVEQFTQSNALFCEYYQRQLARDLVAPEQWRSFCESLCTGLPVTLRLCAGRFPAYSAAHSALLTTGDQIGSRGSHVCETTGATVQQVLQSLSSRLPRSSLGDAECDLSPATKHALLWQVAVDARELAKAARLNRLRSWVRRECALGHVTRQALTSMLPVAVLGLKPQHIVLDVCASPGSKTDHALDLVRCGSSSGSSDQNDALKGRSGGGGVVVANDKDPKRVKTLLGRLEGACKAEPGLVVTCAPAQELHRLLRTDVNGNAESTFLHHTSFDRVLCDVPCSGDGTVRKHPHLLRHWTPERASELHNIQLDIATGAVRALAVGGRMSYSTCSMNPIENEAVVLALLRMGAGALTVVAAEPEVVQGLTIRPGLKTWEEDVSVDSDDDDNDDDADTSANKSKSSSKYSVVVEVSKGEAKALAKCMRILPHDQDTGGFFVAVIEKVRALPTAARGTKAHSGTQHRALQQLGYNPKNSAGAEESKYAAAVATDVSQVDEVESVLGLNCAGEFVSLCVCVCIVCSFSVWYVYVCGHAEIDVLVSF